jgi:hypothetical protein
VAAAPAAATEPLDPYRTLQVEPAADLEQIHAAYRRLARLYHPDLNSTPEASERMADINAAYRLLSDPRQRAAYDARRYLTRAPHPARHVPAGQPRTAVYAPPPEPSPLQRRADRVVALVGIALLVMVGFLAVKIVPAMERSASTHAVGSDVADRISSNDVLRNFPGPVLVPPSGLEPFHSMPILRVDANARGIARYAVYYGDLNTGGAAISGLVGRDAFDTATPRLSDCAPSATYCSGAVPGQTDGPPGLELFRRADFFEDFPSVMTHRVCCNGVFWSFSWYEPRANMSYTLDLSRSVAQRYGNSSADGDVNAARAVAALAAQLVRLS